MLDPDARVDVTVPGLAHASGVVLSAIILPFLLATHPATSVKPGFTGKTKVIAFTIITWALFLPALLLRIPGPTYYITTEYVDTFMHLSIGRNIPFTFYFFYRRVPIARQGIIFGSAFSLTVLMWAVCAVFGQSESAQVVLQRITIVFHVQTVALVVLAALLTCMIYAIATGKAGPDANPVPAITTSGNGNKYIWRMLVAMVLFLILNSFLDASLFPNLGRSPRLTLALAIVLGPAVGYSLDRWKGVAFGRHMIWCSLVFMFMPSLAVLEHSPLMYNIIRTLTILAYFTILISINLALAALVRSRKLMPLAYSAVHTLRYLSFLALMLYDWIMPLSQGEVVAITTLLAVLFYIIISRVDLNDIRTGRDQALSSPAQFASGPIPAIAAGAGSGLIGSGWINSGLGRDSSSVEPDVRGDSAGSPVPADAVPGVPDQPEQRNYAGLPAAEVFTAHNLSPRECEVASMVLAGKPAREIAAALSISEHTVKSHVRNILGKFNAPTRKALLFMFTPLSDDAK
ncbi:MAG: helix-turn-helix transcriptional regulator [Planctomycetes bacterium]|nr:helix-turn-helix transcriptional regulator [Planctomycetota bacterium]